MSGGERQMVAIGRAMMSHPSILMLDEPSLGLSPILCSELFRSLKDVKETGVGIFLVEQNAKQSLAIADRGYLLDNGHITGADTATALASDEAVINAYLGGKEPKGKASIQPRVQASALPVETSNAIQAGRRAIVRTPIEELLPHSVSDLVRHATLTQSEHVGANRAISSNGNGKDTAKVNGDISNKAEAPELDDLQKMLLQMEKAAADTLSGSKG